MYEPMYEPMREEHEERQENWGNPENDENEENGENGEVANDEIIGIIITGITIGVIIGITGTVIIGQSNRSPIIGIILCIILSVFVGVLQEAS